MKNIAYILAVMSGLLLQTTIVLGAPGDVPVGTGEGLKIKPPLPIWPSDYETITDRKPTFRINGRFKASWYRVELSTDATFSDPIVLKQTEVAETDGITPVVFVKYEGKPLADGQYFYRAFCGDDDYETIAANYRTFFVSDIDRDAIKMIGDGKHPRLLSVEALLKEVSDLDSPDAPKARAMQFHINAALNRLDVTPPDEDYARGGKGQHGNYGTASAWYHAHLVPCAFIARATGDQKLIDKCVEMIQVPCGFTRWLGPSFHDPKAFNPVWNSALETASMTYAVSKSYDLLYDYLTEEQRELVRNALVEKGIKPLINDWVDPVGSSAIPRHQLPTGNWVMVCTSSAGIASLTLLGEHPEAERWVRLVRNRVRAWLRDRGGDWFVDNPWINNRPDPIPVIGPSQPNFGIDGGYKETVGYMNYAMHHVVAFADPLHDITGDNLFDDMPEGLLDELAWSLMAWEQDGGVASRIIPFGDTGDVTAYYEALLAACIKHQKSGLAAWMYRRIIPVPTTINGVFWYDPNVAETPPNEAVPMKVFRGIGDVIMRSGWSPDSPMAAIKFHQNRGHFDIGTFFAYGGGGRTLIEGGVTNYGGKIYHEFSGKTHAHNLVMVDDKPQERVDGEIICALGTSRLTGCSGELKAAYPGKVKSWRRDMVMLPERACVVIDRIEGDGDHQFDLLLHPEHPFEMTDDNAFRVGEDIRRGNVQVYSDHDFKSTLLDGYDRTLPRKYVRFNSDAKATQQSFVTAIRWPESEADASKIIVRPMKPGQWRIMHNKSDSIGLINVGPVESPRLVSDAGLLVLWRMKTSGQETHTLMFDGTMVRVGKNNIIQSDKPINAAIESSDALRISFWNDNEAEVKVMAGQERKLAFLDKQPIEVTREGLIVTVKIPAGEHDLVLASDASFVERKIPALKEDLLAVPSLDAPAYHKGISTTSSTLYAESLNAIDGDINTYWTSLPGLPMPQWFQVNLQEVQPVGRVSLVTGYQLSGHVDIYTADSDEPVRTVPFKTDEFEAESQLTFEPVKADRIRIVFDAIDAASSAALISELRWSKD